MPNVDKTYPLLAIDNDDRLDPLAKSGYPPDNVEVELYEALAELDDLDDSTLGDIDEQNLLPLAAREPVTIADAMDGVTKLATMGVVEITDIVEAMHREILLRPLGRFTPKHLNRWQRGLTARIYGSVRQTANFVGDHLANGLNIYHSIVNQNNRQPLPRRLKLLVKVLNGVMGDHLVTHDNPLAVPMMLYDRFGQVPTCQRRDCLSGRVVILCHGLCMSHLSWHPNKKIGLGFKLETSLPDTTVLYLDYNSGRRISINGRDLSFLLDDLLKNHPNISQIDLVGHSMGGLVARSALFYGTVQRLDWIDRVGNLVTLGSPHHGASLERIGHFVQDIISKLPFAGSLAKLGDLRSAGIIDLRHGSVRDEDWQSLDGRDVLPQAFRHPARLPFHVRGYLVAATLVEGHYDSKATSLFGDGLVNVASALGEDSDIHTLQVPEHHKAVFYGVGHNNLLYNDRVHQQIIQWLLANGQDSSLPQLCVHSYPNDLSVVI